MLPFTRITSTGAMAPFYDPALDACRRRDLIVAKAERAQRDAMVAHEPTSNPPPRRVAPSPATPTEHCDCDLPIFILPIDGRRPERQSVCRILSALHDVPSRFYPPWIAAGGKMEMVAGLLASVHPRYGSDPRPAAGFAEGPFCVVGADAPGATKTAIHELGHALDSVLRISSRPEWLRLFEAATRDGRTRLWGALSRAGQLQPPNEYFAEMFAFKWVGLDWYVPGPVQDFIAFDLLR